MRFAFALLPGVVALALAGTPAEAQRLLNPRLNEAAALRTSLDCRIEIEKVIVVTNTTGGPLAAGTPLQIDLVHIHTAAIERLTYTTPAIPAGGVLERGTRDATSCTASIPRTLLLAP